MREESDERGECKGVSGKRYYSIDVWNTAPATDDALIRNY